MFDHLNFVTDVNLDACVGHQCWIVSEKFAPEIEPEWIKVFERDETGDPYSKGLHSNAVLRSYDQEALTFDFYIDAQTRHHSIYLKLPHRMVKHWVSIPQYNKHDYVFVDETWHSQFWAGHISTFLFVDAIGMRKQIEGQDVQLLNRLDALSDRIDEIATKHKETMLFVSASDNVIVKANFSALHKYPFYEPELLLPVFLEIKSAIQQTLSCDAYGIFTQGQNIYNDRLYSYKQGSSHFNLRSLGVPYADLFEMESQIRRHLRDKVHAPYSGYFDLRYFNSLDLKYRPTQRWPLYEYKSGHYSALNVDEVIRNLDSRAEFRKKLTET